MGNANLVTIFLTGLLTGGLTCMAVQGGLLAATLAQREEEHLKAGLTKTGNALPILAFLLAKLVAYTLLGFLLGWVGSLFKLSIPMQVYLQLAVAIFMIGTALNILNVHPFFRNFIIQPPKFLTRLVRQQSKSADVFAPAILGAFTIFIPCGTTQAMMALAIASGNPFLGAAVLFSFILGTSPVFFVLGYFATKLGDMFHESFMKLAAIAIIILALFNINNAISLTGSNLTIGNLAKNFWCVFAYCQESQSTAVASDKPIITISSYGYNPQTIRINRGQKVNLTVQNQDGRGCQQAFTIPSLGYEKLIPPGTTETIQFVAPSSSQQIAFMCSMGMYRGVIEVL